MFGAVALGVGNDLNATCWLVLVEKDVKAPTCQLTWPTRSCEIRGRLAVWVCFGLFQFPMVLVFSEDSCDFDLWGQMGPQCKFAHGREELQKVRWRKEMGMFQWVSRCFNLLGARTLNHQRVGLSTSIIPFWGAQHTKATMSKLTVKDSVISGYVAACHLRWVVWSFQQIRLWHITLNEDVYWVKLFHENSEEIRCWPKVCNSSCFDCILHQIIRLNSWTKRRSKVVFGLPTVMAICPFGKKNSKSWDGSWLPHGF